MRRRRLFKRILKSTGADWILEGFFVLFLFAAFFIWITEPSLTSFWDSIWYCFTVVTTIGFGDQYATTVISRILTMILSFYSIIAVAILTAVITNYSLERMKRRAEMNVSEFLDKLERLPELSKEELMELSDKVREFNKKSDQSGE